MDYKKSFITVFLGYLRGIWRYLRFILILAINFIMSLIILVSGSHKFVTDQPLKVHLNMYIPIFNN
jgi:hypothetical protein